MSGVILALAVLATVSACTRKLDEAMIYDGPQFRIKLVRYYEFMPLHYNGEVFRVVCASGQTRHSPALKMQEAGWVRIGNGSAIGSGSAAELAARERRRYRVIDAGTLVWLGGGVNVSFDACGSFRRWHPVDLPAEWIDPVDKPDYCRPQGTADCRHYDFMGERAARFDALRVSPTGRISFMVFTEALRDARAVRVHSTDFGATWQATRVDGSAS